MQHPLHPLVESQTHALPEHRVPAGHEVPQAPQFFESLVRTTHVPLQFVPVLHTHSLLKQVMPEAHAKEQPPQFFESLVRSAQVSPHCMVPDGHTSVQANPPPVSGAHDGADEVHVAPQAPQLEVDRSEVAQPTPESAQSA